MAEIDWVDVMNYYFVKTPKTDWFWSRHHLQERLMLKQTETNCKYKERQLDK